MERSKFSELFLLKSKSLVLSHWAVPKVKVNWSSFYDKEKNPFILKMFILKCQSRHRIHMSFSSGEIVLLLRHRNITRSKSSILSNLIRVRNRNWLNSRCERANHILYKLWIWNCHSLSLTHIYRASDFYGEWSHLSHTNRWNDSLIIIIIWFNQRWWRVWIKIADNISFSARDLSVIFFINSIVLHPTRALARCIYQKFLHTQPILIKLN
jgi:hypothetical protein